MRGGSGDKVGRRALSERCQYVHVHVRRPYAPARPPGFAFCIRASSLLPLGFWHNAPRGQMRANPRSRPLRSLAPTTSLSVNLPIWSSGGQTNIFAACFLRANWILNRSPACPLLRLSAAPLIAHCDKDRVDTGQRQGGGFPVRCDFLVIT